MPDDTVGTKALADQAGVSYRQVDYWTRHGVLHPVQVVPSAYGSRRKPGAWEPGSWEPTPQNPGSGYQRRYPPIEVKVAHAMGHLSDALGLSVLRAGLIARGYAEGERQFVLDDDISIILHFRCGHTPLSDPPVSVGTTEIRNERGTEPWQATQSSPSSGT